MQAILKNYGIMVGNSQELRNSYLKNCGIVGQLDKRLFSKTVGSYTPITALNPENNRSKTARG